MMIQAILDSKTVFKDDYLFCSMIFLLIKSQKSSNLNLISSYLDVGFEQEHENECSPSFDSNSVKLQMLSQLRIVILHFLMLWYKCSLYLIILLAIQNNLLKFLYVFKRGIIYIHIQLTLIFEHLRYEVFNLSSAYCFFFISA